MKLTAKGEYALRLVLHLASSKEKELVKLSVISDKEDISLAYLHQLVKNLKKDGILISTRGPNGGYSLGRDAKDITILQVLASSGEKIKSFELASKGTTANEKKVRKFFLDLDNEVLKALDKPVTFLLRKKS